MKDSELTYAQTDHRYSYLNAVRKLVPKCFEDLRGLLPVFQAMFYEVAPARKQQPVPVGHTPYGYPGDVLRVIRWTGELSSGGPLLRNLDLNTVEGKRVHDALKAWAATYNLTDSWILDGAVLTLLDWMNNPKNLKSGAFSLHGWTLAGYEGYALFDHRLVIDEYWNPDEKWPVFRKRIEDRLNEYKGAMEARRQKLRFDPGKKRKVDHFNWLALFQAKEHSPGKIQEWLAKEGLTVELPTIQRGIDDAALLCGIKLRPGTRGPKRSN